MIFIRKASRVDHSAVTFDTVTFPVARTPRQKHLGLHLDERLNFSHHIKEKISEACTGISVIRTLIDLPVLFFSMGNFIFLLTYNMAVADNVQW